MGTILLEDMEFYAYHGCFKEEQVAGNRFMVSLKMETDMTIPSKTDSITDALNYQTAYALIRKEMSVKAHLLEHVSERILNALFLQFSQLQSATVKVSKMNPPMGGSMLCVSVEQTRKR